MAKKTVQLVQTGYQMYDVLVDGRKVGRVWSNAMAGESLGWYARREGGKKHTAYHLRTRAAAVATLTK